MRSLNETARSVGPPPTGDVEHCARAKRARIRAQPQDHLGNFIHGPSRFIGLAAIMAFTPARPAVPESEAGVQAFPIRLATSPQPGPGRSGLQRGVANRTRHLTLRRKDLGRIRARLTADSYERKPNEINPPEDVGGRCRTSLSPSHGENRGSSPLGSANDFNG